MSTATPPATQPAPAGIAGVNGVMFVALIAGAAGLGISVLGYLTSPADFFRAYLVAYCFCVGISLGSLALLMIQHLLGGQWGLVLRRPLEAACSPAALFVLALLFLPLLPGLQTLYPWADVQARLQQITATQQEHDAVAAQVKAATGDAKAPLLARQQELDASLATARGQLAEADPHGILQGRQLYMNVPLFIVRFGVFFAIWVGLAACFQWWSIQEDQTADARGVQTLGSWFRHLAAPGLVIYALTVSFAGIDWGMSVNAFWYSTMYPVLFAFGGILSALVFLVAVLILLKPHTRLGALATHQTLADLGSMMLAFTMMWAYLSFSQFLLIWSANLRGEAPYYTQRLGKALAMDQDYFNAHTFGGFGWIAALLVVGHFLIPFLLLLVRGVRHSPTWLLGIAIWMLVMRFVDYHWTISPTLTNGEMRPGMVWLDLATAVGVLGLVVGVFLWQLQRQPIVPEHDPRLAHAEGQHHG